MDQENPLSSGASRLFGWMLAVFIAFAPASRADTPVLTTVREIRNLTPEEAGKGRPVRITAVVTFSRPKLATLFIHDGDAGIFVEQPVDNSGHGPKFGQKVEVTGITGAGLFAAVISGEGNQGAKVVILGEGELPVPKRVTGEELSSLAMDSQWVELETRIEEVIRIKDGVVFQCKTGTCNFHLFVEGPVPPDSVPWDYAESEVKIRGVAASAFNNSRQMTRRVVRVNSLADIKPMDREPVPRMIPVPSSVGQLLRINGPGPGELVNLKGTTTLNLPGRGLFLRTGDGGLWVQSAQPIEAPVGTIVEVDGWPRPGEIKPFLRARRMRVLGNENPPTPQPLSVKECLFSQHDSELVSVEAELLNIAPSMSGSTMVLRGSGMIFTGSLSEGDRRRLARFEPGSRIRLTGIARLSSANIFNPLQKEDKLLILLRSPEDVVLIAKPPWWTPWKVSAAAALIIAMMLGGYWIAKQRRVREEETKHREYEAVLAERGRFAREIHDSLAQGLTSISLQLECVRDEIKGEDSKLRSHIETARRLVRDSLREARRTIWNLRPLALGEADLASALQRYANDLSRDASISTSQEIEGTPRTLPSEHESALLRIGQEALANAIRHASPGHVLLRLRYGTDWITLTVKDDGSGFDVAAKARQGFGLTGMHERAAALGGSLSIDSISGEGTEVSATLPT